MAWPAATNGTVSHKKIITFCIILGEDKLYTEILELDEIYDFIVDNFFI